MENSWVNKYFLFQESNLLTKHDKKVRRLIWKKTVKSMSKWERRKNRLQLTMTAILVPLLYLLIAGKISSILSDVINNEKRTGLWLWEMKQIQCHLRHILAYIILLYLLKIRWNGYKNCSWWHICLQLVEK